MTAGTIYTRPILWHRDRSLCTAARPFYEVSRGHTPRQATTCGLVLLYCKIRRVLRRNTFSAVVHSSCLENKATGELYLPGAAERMLNDAYLLA